MSPAELFRQHALAFDAATEQPHFDKLSFRVHKKIFATLEAGRQRAVLKLSEVDQSVFCQYNPALLYPAPGAWGRQGWTVVELREVPAEMLLDALTCAYCQTAPPRLAAHYRPR